MSDTLDSVKSKLTGVGGKASDAAPSEEDVKQGARRAAGVAKENPIGLALAGVAVGFLVGMAIPSTDVEDEKIGSLSTQVKEKVKETGEDALDHGKDVAQDALQSAKETAQESAQEHGEQLKQSTQEKAQAAKQEAATQS